MIKKIFDEIAKESSINRKLEILNKNKDNELLKNVLYKACSKRVKFYIKQIPEYKRLETHTHPLEGALMSLDLLSSRSVTGHEAIQHLKEILMCCEPDDAYVIERIIEKDPKIGVASKLLNKVWDNLIERVGYQGCKPYSRELVEKLFKNHKKVFSQLKLDGLYSNVIVDNGESFLESRQGEVISLDNPCFLSELNKLPNCVLNGELTMRGIERYKSNGMIDSLMSISIKKNKGEDISKEINKFEKNNNILYRDALDLITLTFWDKLTINEYYLRKSDRIYEERFEDLESTINNYNYLFVVENRIVKNFEEAKLHFKEVLNRKLEGTVLKASDGLWVDSKPNYQIKIKKEVKLDLKITGFSYGDKGTKNENLISSILVESEDGKLKAVAGGISEEKMEELTKNKENYLNTIVEVKCNGISFTDNGYSLLHPRFLKFRNLDKTVADNLDECIKIHESSSF